MGRMNAIRNLKQLEFSLGEIKELFESGQRHPPREFIAAKMAACRAEQARLEQRMAELEKLEK